MNKQELIERIKSLTPEDLEKLKEYNDALKEIKKEIKEILSGGKVEEEGGNYSSDLYLNPEE
jgi:hypothetical protein